MEIIKIGFLAITLKDIFDIIVVTFLLYKIYQVLSGTRAAQMLIGLVFIFVISFVVQAFELSGTNWIFENFKTVWLIAFVILFQPELRRLLIYAGRNPLVRIFVRVRKSEVLEEVARAAVELSDKRYGALMVLTRDTGIKGIIETGVALQSKVSRALLVSLFFPRSPLHDGAVIISGGMIEAAKCILPLTQNRHISKTLGIRHQAALGMSEESDAVVVVVSEETGKISIAQNGVLKTDLDYNVLSQLLSDAFGVST